MHNLQRKRLSQNFIHSRKLVKRLVGQSSIAKNDLVVEIGPGKGIITEQLVQQAGRVVAVELDKHWVDYLQIKVSGVDNFVVHHQDVLDWSLPQLPYKVFANIPFSIEGKIVRRLIDAPHPPQDCYLVMMQSLAYRLAALNKENQFSMMHKPWFDFSIYHQFQPTDFTPVPKVNAAMLRFTLKKKPLLPISEKKQYQTFIAHGFGCGLAVKQNLSAFYVRETLDRAFYKSSLANSAKPGYLTLEQWLGLYKALGKSK